MTWRIERINPNPNTTTTAAAAAEAIQLQRGYHRHQRLDGINRIAF